MTTGSVTPAAGGTGAGSAPGSAPDAPGTPTAAPGRSPLGAVPALRVAGVLGAGVTLVAVLALVDLTLGTSGIGARELLGLLTGGGDASAEQTAAVLVASRLPRVFAALLVGVALGVSGAMLQSVARNPLASPDTLAVNAGSYLLVAVAAVTGLTLPFAATGAVAFVGGLGAAALVLLLSRGGASGPTRLVLAGSAVMLALSALTSLLLLLFEQETIGLFAWGSGSIVQSGPEKVGQAAPVVLLVAVVAVVRARRLDLLALGDDTATVLGLDVRRTRVEAVLVAVLLAAVAVTVAGPIGFVGLCAPAIARLVAPLAPGLHRHRLLLPLSALAGCVVVLAADILLRTWLPGTDGVAVPTGVVTSVFGAVVLVALARRVRDSSPVSAPSTARTRAPATRRRFLVVTAVLAALVVATVVGGLLLGDTLLLTGDVANWLSGRSGPGVTAVLDQRAPRVLASLVAGAALALAGTTVQAVCRNPLAEPGLLGVTGGAGVGAILLLVLVPGVSIWAVTGAGGLGALVAFALVYGLAYRRGLSSDRLVLIGIGVSAGTTALVTIIVVTSSPWDSTLALTWMSGSTYGRSFAQSLPVLGMLLLVTPFVARARRDLDLLALDEDVPRVLGVPLERTRLGLLLASVLLAGSAVSAIGVVGFVGLVAPHAARALVGARHTRVVPVALLLGAALVGISDVLGRTVIAPAQIPAGLVTALVGTPYFVLLLWRTRA
jgi:ABC-type Fe3+-siderophore transport system permease subunit